ncbi:MAG: hypothetical protein K6T26_06095 [Alicyclobacillus sp.]|nr:hypothetical protein [Alicyclobacillus sp.]
MTASSPSPELALIALLVAVDNALFAGVVLPWTDAQHKRRVIQTAGAALAVVQTLCVAGIGSLFGHGLFRAAAALILALMAARTVAGPPGFRTPWSHTREVARVLIYTLLGNLDNLLWLGSALRHQYVWLALYSVATVPVFVVVAIFLSDQCQRHRWVLWAGAGFMAWAAARLCLDLNWIPQGKREQALAVGVQGLIGAAILVVGWGWGWWRRHRSRVC